MLGRGAILADIGIMIVSLVTWNCGWRSYDRILISLLSFSSLYVNCSGDAMMVGSHNQCGHSVGEEGEYEKIKRVERLKRCNYTCGMIA